MTRREANLLTALVLFLLALGLALSAPRWARFLREPVASLEDDILGGVSRNPAGDEAEQEGRRTISVKLYFPEAEGAGLLGEEREVPFSNDVSQQIRSVVDELLKGPNTALLPAFASGTKALEVFVNARGVAYVDLSSEARSLPGPGSQGELLSVYALVNSVVVNFPVVKRVQLLVDDKPVETLGGHVDLSRPLLPDMTFLARPKASPSPAPISPEVARPASEPGP
ncbi:MAG TPA: GerMN domain-containing protein [Vicinamibacteria bacterium]